MGLLFSNSSFFISASSQGRKSVRKPPLKIQLFKKTKSFFFSNNYIESLLYVDFGTKKTTLSKIRISRTVLKTQLMQNSPNWTIINENGRSEGPHQWPHLHYYILSFVYFQLNFWGSIFATCIYILHSLLRSANIISWKLVGKTKVFKPQNFRTFFKQILSYIQRVLA